MWRWVVSAALIGTLLPCVASADVYSYTQENGTPAFTDDPDQVPERYRGAMTQSPDRSLDDYERFTVRETDATLDPAERAAAAALRRALAMPGPGLPAQVPAHTGPAGPPGAAPSYIQAAPGVWVPAQAGPGDEPLRVERRYKWIEGRYTPVIIVRRGDEVLVETEDLFLHY